MDVNKTFQLGVEAIKKKKFKEAEKIFKHLLDKQSNNYEVNHFLGIVYQLMNNVNEAIIYYRKTIEINPEFAEAHKNLGNMFYRLGEIYNAEVSYKKSLEINPLLEEARKNLNVVFGQKEVCTWMSNSIVEGENSKKKIDLNPFISKRKVEPELLAALYNINTIKLNETGDVRFGNGKCSSNSKLFENKNETIQLVAKDIITTIENVIGSKVFIQDSFFNILQAGSGTKPHKHLEPFDKKNKFDEKKYSLTYYISVGDQSGKEPGILKLYNPEQEILPSEGTMVIIPSGRSHSSSYDGKKDRVMIGANFYSAI